MQRELGKFNIPFEFMLKGDKSEISSEIIKEYFIGDEMSSLIPTAQQSCTYKHLSIYEKMLIDGVDDALVFEDDIYLADNFIEVFNKTIEELKSLTQKNQDKALVNFENSTLQTIHPSDQLDGKHLYMAEKSRCAGAYYLNKNLAKSITDYRIDNKCNKIIDWYHNELIDKIGLQNYWCHPPIVEQGSHNGKIKSLIDDKKVGIFRQIAWKINRIYKHKISPLIRKIIKE
jgi:glycosyl transferase family 25